ncbi:acyltransferase family protein [Mucilaginibacter sp. RCC_168]|uniref:acyltransferase family protein n=1 Tax=Mucilaginibacter sp. RCC_168 TaxID=3239221 RepID=UPI0035258F06
MNRIKSIDGLRAISIIMVLLGHGGETMPSVITHNFFFQFAANSTLGVRIFFVISGYLITKLLIIEKEKTGKNSLKHFYIRRIFRIFPIFYIYILVIILLKVFFIPDIFKSYNSVVIAGLYLWNYQPFFHPALDLKGGWFFGHFWTLAMEEQFYLLWPITFILITNKQRLKKLILIVIILMPILRIIIYFLFPFLRGQIRLMLPTGGDTILIGCLGALIESSPNFKEKYYKYIQNRLLVTLAILFVAVLSPILYNRFKGGYDLSVGISINNVFILLILFWSIYSSTLFSRILNNKILVQIGVLSYSLYIWQQLFLTDLNNFWVNKFPQNLAIVFIVGFLSYYIIEKPILKLKNRFKDI